jgi:hypothetical protein
MRGKKLVRRLAMGFAGVLVLAVGFLFLTEPGKALVDIWRTGAVQAALSEPEKRKYNATTESNLKAIYTALMLYHESEGQFPEAAGWMDAIQNRITTADMEGSESKKKLMSPSLGGVEGQYGYAMNDAASKKYRDDLDAKLPLIFDSSDASRNAHGDPSELLPKPPRAGQNMAVAVDGSILRL